jgi:hypothetical protein
MLPYLSDVLSSMIPPGCFPDGQLLEAPDPRPVIRAIFREWRAQPLVIFWRKKKGGMKLIINGDPDDLAGSAGDDCGFVNSRKWSDWEIEILRKYYPTGGSAEVARLTGRTTTAAGERAHALKIKASPELMKRLRIENCQRGRAKQAAKRAEMAQGCTII